MQCRRQDAPAPHIARGTVMWPSPATTPISPLVVAGSAARRRVAYRLPRRPVSFSVIGNAKVAGPTALLMGVVSNCRPFARRVTRIESSRSMHGGQLCPCPARHLYADRLRLARCRLPRSLIKEAETSAWSHHGGKPQLPQDHGRSPEGRARM